MPQASLRATSVQHSNGTLPDPGALWSALADDTGAQVMVFDEDGVIHHANAAATRELGSQNGDIVGRRLSDFYPAEVVAERLSIIRQKASEGRPITIDGLLRGRFTRQVCRVFSAQPVRILATTRAAAGEPAAVHTITATANDAGPLSSLTARELEILKLISLGHSTAEIAEKLSRSVKTVEWHRVSLGEKLGVTNRVELARLAIAAGLVGLDDRTAGSRN